MSVQAVAQGRYAVERLLGRGGMALVYLARDRRLDRPVAIKLLADNLAVDPELRRRFLREATFAERLSHPNVVQVLGHGHSDGRPYIVLEYVDGPNLADELRRRGSFPAHEVASFGAQAAAGLAHAHAHGLVHRDVKPQNLLLAGDGLVKVADFGIARVAEGTRLTEVGTILGTAAYLSPEQAAGAEVGTAADVYSLGVCLYELLTGRTPFRGSTLTELVLSRHESAPQAPSALAAGVPPALEALTLRCLAPEPERRPSAEEVERTLATVDSEAQTRVLRERSADPAAVFRHGRRRTIAAVAVIVAVLVGAGFAVALDGSHTGRPAPRPPARVAPVPPASTPAGEARSLARWLRANSR